MPKHEYKHTEGKLRVYHSPSHKADLEVVKGNANYLCVKPGELNMAAEIANLRDSPFKDEVKNLNAKRLQKCWNMHDDLVTMLERAYVIAYESEGSSKLVKDMSSLIQKAKTA